MLTFDQFIRAFQRKNPGSYTMARRKSKPVFTFNVDSAKDHFTFDYLADGLSVHAEGSMKQITPRIRALLLPAMSVVGNGLGGIFDGVPVAVDSAGIPTRRATKAEAKVIRKGLKQAREGKLISKGSLARFARGKKE